MKSLVTGGAGFIGSHLVELLLEKGHEVIIIDNLSTGKRENLIRCKKAILHPIDILELDSLYPLFKSVDWVFHLAGLAACIPSIEKPIDYFDVNVKGTLHVLEASRKNRIGRVIYAASSSCYGEPKEFPTPETAEKTPELPYALTKHMGEELVLLWDRVYGLSTLSLRLFNVYGPRASQSVLSIFAKQKLGNEPFSIVGDGGQTRDFIHVSDVARAFYKAAESNLRGCALNVGSGIEESINSIADRMGASHRNYLKKRKGESNRSLADISKIKRELNWEPKISIIEGLESLLR